MAASPPVRLVYADGPDGPLPDPAAIAGLVGFDPARLQVVLGWVVRDPAPAWLADPQFEVTTLLVGPGTRRAVATGAVRAVGTRLSAVPELLEETFRPTVAVVGGVANGSGYRLAGSVGWAPDAARVATMVVVERHSGPLLPGPAVEGHVVAVYDRTDPPDSPPTPTVGAAEARIGQLVAGLVPDGATIQWGPGTIGAAVAAAIDRPVRVHSGLATDELVGLVERGLLVGTATAAYRWGGPGLAALVEEGRLQLRPVRQTHDLGAVAAIDRFVAVNTAIEVGLDGAVNVEAAGARLVAGPGGHPDFCAGAIRSRGGLSIVALRATAGSDHRSTIVVRPATVSTPRSDIDVVVTEHGIAHLRGASDMERATRLIAVAAPEHRDALAGATSP